LARRHTSSPSRAHQLPSYEHQSHRREWRLHRSALLSDDSCVLNPPSPERDARRIGRRGLQPGLSASGGVSPNTFSATGGALPAGLTLTTDGVLSGTLTSANTFNFTIADTDDGPGLHRGGDGIIGTGGYVWIESVVGVCNAGRNDRAPWSVTEHARSMRSNPVTATTQRQSRSIGHSSWTIAVVAPAPSLAPTQALASTQPRRPSWIASCCSAAVWPLWVVTG
jgi:hypothetical protein